MSGNSTILADGSTLPTLDAQLRRYNRSYRRRLRKFVRSSERSRDLLYTFPAAAFTIAGAHGNPLRRAEAYRLVQDGASLRDVGIALDLPNWLRRLPPEAFVEAVGKMPCGDVFGRRIVNLIPKDPAQTPMWLNWVLRGNSLCDETFALWISHQRISWADHADASSVVPLAAFAWYSGAEHVRARGFIERPWTPELNLSKAISATKSWFTRCLEDTYDSRHASTGRWFVTQRRSGYRIVPLRTHADLQDEGNRMHHCVGDYANQVMMRTCLIYSIRRGNDHVATLEIRSDWRKERAPYISQLRGPYNDDVDEDVFNAASKWLARQGNYPFAGFKQSGYFPFDEQRWAALWDPFRSANPERKLRLEPFHLDRGIMELSQYL